MIWQSIDDAPKEIKRLGQEWREKIQLGDFYGKMLHQNKGKLLILWVHNDHDHLVSWMEIPHPDLSEE